MRSLLVTIIFCAALLVPPTDLPAQPGPGPSPWSFGVCGGYSLAIQEGFTAPSHDGMPEELFPLGIGHGYNAGICAAWYHGKSALIAHLLFERRPLSMEKSVGSYDAIDADGGTVRTAAMRRIDLRYDMIAGDLLYAPYITHLGPASVSLLAGPSFGYLVDASLEGRVTVPEPYRALYNVDHAYSDDGRTAVFDESFDGFKRFRAGIAAGVMFEVWEPWSDRMLVLGFLADYGLTHARAGAAWKVHGVRIDLEWRYGVFKPAPKWSGEGSDPL